MTLQLTSTTLEDAYTLRETFAGGARKLDVFYKFHEAPDRIRVETFDREGDGVLSSGLKMETQVFRHRNEGTDGWVEGMVKKFTALGGGPLPSPRFKA